MTKNVLFTILFLTSIFLGSSVVILLYFFKQMNIDPPRYNSTPIVNQVESSPSPHTWSLLITGDVIPARVVNIQMTNRNDFSWPLNGIKEILQNADLTLIDLEAPLLVNCPLTNEGFKFCGDARFAQALAVSEVDVANIANNHSLNYGWDGIRETEEELAKVGIETTGFYTSSQIAVGSLQNNDETLRLRSGNIFSESCDRNSFCSKLLVKTIPTSANCSLPTANCITVGFLGYNAVGQRVDREVAKRQIKSADSQVDVLVVSVHWGKEYEREPIPDHSLAPDDPKELGRLFVDWGADVVVGNHPHWYQGVEWYSSSIITERSRSVSAKPIFYALGNTVFDQEWSVETRRGYLAKLYFKGKEIQKNKLEIYPIGIRNFGEAYLLEGEEKEQILQIEQSKGIVIDER